MYIDRQKYYPYICNQVETYCSSRKMGRPENMISKSLLVLTVKHIVLRHFRAKQIVMRALDAFILGLLIIESARKHSKIGKTWSRRYCSNLSLYGTQKKIPFFKAGIVHCYTIVDISYSSVWLSFSQQ